MSGRGGRHYQQQRGYGGRGGGSYRGGGRGRGRDGGGRGDRGGRRGGGRAPGGGRGGRGGGGRANMPDLSGLRSVVTNIFPAAVTLNFSFYQYSIDSTHGNGEQIESRSQRQMMFHSGMWDKLLRDMPEKQKNDLKRVVFFTGSSFYSARPIAGLEPDKLPFLLFDGEDGDSMTCVAVAQFQAPAELSPGGSSNIQQDELSFDPTRCNGCTRTFSDSKALLQHARDSGHSLVYQSSNLDQVIVPTPEVFLAYANLVLQRALDERLARWGRDHVDPQTERPAKDRRGNELGVNIYKAYECRFGIVRVRGGAAELALQCDLRAKIIRTNSVLHAIYDDPTQKAQLGQHEQNKAKRAWIGEVVIYLNEKKCYTVTDLDFEHSAGSLPIPGKNISHAQYFEKKGIKLSYPNKPPMIAVLGRREQTIYLPAELVVGNELDPQVQEMLPQIASFTPSERNEAIEDVKKFLIPGAQKTKNAGGLLPSVGIVLKSERIAANATVLAAPNLIAAGIQVPGRSAENWAPVVNKAKFNVNPKQAVDLNVVLFYPSGLKRGAPGVYEKIKNFVNGFNASFRFTEKPHEMIEVSNEDRGHWGAVEKYFSGRVPDNVFVLDFVKPFRTILDPSYPVVKRILAQSGYLSQFVNFNKQAHDAPRDAKKSSIALQGVARQILQKAGVRLWWVQIPESLPLPSVFVGVDVFHAPMVYDPRTKKRGRKASVAAIIVQIVRKSGTNSTKMELYSEAFKREGGEEYGLGEAIQKTLSTALKKLQVQPKSLVMWRDGIGESAFATGATGEIKGIRKALAGNVPVGGGKQPKGAAEVPLAYIVCQKRIGTKFLSRGIPGEEDGKFGAPSGTLVSDIQGLEHQTFYINGRAPPFSTPKPTRYIIVERDEQLMNVPIARLTWAECHNYPNWTGPIKVPGVCQMAHKLAELAGGMADGGDTIDSDKYANTIYFL